MTKLFFWILVVMIIYVDDSLPQNNYYSRKKVEAKHIHPDQISFYNSFFFRDFTAKSAARAVSAM